MKAGKGGPSAWAGFGGDDHIADPGEWQSLLRRRAQGVEVECTARAVGRMAALVHLPPRQAPLGECIPRVWPLYAPLSAQRTYELKFLRGSLSRKMKCLACSIPTRGTTSHTIS